MNFGKLLDRFRKLPPRLQIALGAAGAIVIVFAFVASILARDNRTALFARPLASDQLSEVLFQLAAWHAPFASTPDNVLVERSDRSDLLLRLSLAGVPHPHVDGTDDALAKMSALTPQSVLDVQERRGLENDLVNALRGISGVADAQVIVAPAKPAFFADEASHDASASVRVKLRPGSTLKTDTVEGIRRFVAGAVSGLDRSRVEVVDDSGAPLSMKSNAILDTDALQNQIQSALDSTIGLGMTIVRVHAEYDSQAHRTTDVRRTPLFLDKPISVDRMDERYESPEKHYSRARTSVDRGSDSLTRQAQSDPGSLARLTVAVFVDQAKRSEVAKIKELVSAAAGIDARRGDVLSVDALPFPRSSIADVPPNSAAMFAPLVPLAICSAAVIAIVAIASKPIAAFFDRSKNRELLAAVVVSSQTFDAQKIRALLKGEPPAVAAAIVAQLPAAEAVSVLALYGGEEREAISSRMARRTGVLVPDLATMVAERA